MITPYYCGFMLFPIPLELSGMDCSYQCRYCFTRIKEKKTPFSIQKYINLLKTKHNNTTLTKYLLDESYPVLLSNRSDPFCHSNINLSIKLIELLLQFGIPITYQTKGFCRPLSEVKEFIKDLPKSCWYITIAFDSEELREKFEPNAPMIKHRFELIELLKSLGHEVFVGLNPLTSEWVGGLSGVEKLLLKFKALGVYGIWTELLYFSRNFIPIMKDSDKELFGNLIKKYLSGKYDANHPNYQFFLAVKQRIKDIGLEPYGGTELIKSDYLKPYYEIYPKLWPTYQGFYNWCCENKQDNDIVTFDDSINYSNGIIVDDSIRKSEFKSYVVANSIGLLMQRQIPNAINMRYLMKLYWEEELIRNGIAHYPNFRWINGDNSKMRFSQKSFDDMWGE